MFMVHMSLLDAVYWWGEEAPAHNNLITGVAAHILSYFATPGPSQ